MKPYQRGNFRVVKYPRFHGYQVQVLDRDGLWNDLDVSFDYLANARLRVRNLHAACCTHVEISDIRYGIPMISKTARRYIKTGKIAKNRFK